MHGHTNVKNDKTDLQSECYSSVGKTQKHRGKTDVGIWGRLRASIRAWVYWYTAMTYLPGAESLRS